MDPNLVASLFANDPNTTNTQPNNPAPQNIPVNDPPQPQNTIAPTPAPGSPTLSTDNQLSPPRKNKYNALNPYATGPRYYSDSESDDEDDNNYPPFSFPGISINSNNNLGNNFGPINNGIHINSNSNNYGPINNGIVYSNGGWPNGNMTIINGRDWSGIPQ